MHDFAITENYALFPIYPTTCDLARLKAGGDHWVHEMNRDSWVGLMPRYGTVAECGGFGTQGRVLLSPDERVRGCARAASSSTSACPT